MTTTKPTKIRIKIGSTFDRTYHLYETNAPRVYDYGTTVEFKAAIDWYPQAPHWRPEDKVRAILIPVFANETGEPMQVGRNSSGLHPTYPVDTVTEGEIVEALFQKMIAKAQEG